jgi:hypothetical protein
MKPCPPVALAGLLLSPALMAHTGTVPPPLGGPEVVEQRIEGVESGFSSMMAPERMARPVPTSVFRRAIAELRGDQAPAGARLTDQQRERLRAIEREHGQALAAFRRKHAEEFRELREAIGSQLASRVNPATDRGRRDDGRAEGSESPRSQRGDPDRRGTTEDRDGMRGEPVEDAQRPIWLEDLTEAQRGAIARPGELRALGPGPEAVQTRIWAELTEAQQAHVQSRINGHRARVAEQRQTAYVERMAARRAASDRGEDAGRGDRPASRRPAQVAPEIAPELRETLEALPAPMRQRLAQLPPERREQILQRLLRAPIEERARILRRLQQDRARRPGSGRNEAPDRSSGPR